MNSELPRSLSHLAAPACSPIRPVQTHTRTLTHTHTHTHTRARSHTCRGEERRGEAVQRREGPRQCREGRGGEEGGRGGLWWESTERALMQP